MGIKHEQAQQLNDAMLVSPSWDGVEVGRVSRKENVLSVSGLDKHVDKW